MKALLGAGLATAVASLVLCLILHAINVEPPAPAPAPVAQSQPEPAAPELDVQFVSAEALADAVPVQSRRPHGRHMVIDAVWLFEARILYVSTDCDFLGRYEQLEMKNAIVFMHEEWRL